MTEHHATTAVGTSPDTFEFIFINGLEGWQPGFADYTVGEDEVINPVQGHEALPDGLEGSGAFLEGRNASADLFMYMKRRLEGLAPDTDHLVTVEVEFTSRYPVGTMGIGGSPAESVFLKLGASTHEPDRVEDGKGMWRMNVDKGNQASGGRHAVTVGTIAKPDDGTFDHVLLQHDNRDRPIPVRTDPGGGLWVLVGTDSGFEGVTRIHYTRVVVTVVPLVE